MKPRVSNQKAAALTLMEVLVVIAILAVIAALLLPALAAAKRKTARIGCVNNLKQIGLSFRLWEGDNGDKYPMSVSVTNGGTMELAAGTNAWISFLVMSNQLSTPKVLHCPEDTNSFAADNFSSGFNHRNISYFVSLDASESDPQALMSGDDNFEVGGVPVNSGLLNLVSNTPIAWSAARHHFAGNVALADGSVQSFSNAGLTNWLSQTGLATNRLAIP
jgi:competence protein ComGC